MNLSRTRKRRVALTLSIAAVLVLIYLPFIAAEESLQTSDSAPPDFQLQDLNGTPVTLSQFKGQKPVLLYFWATWCPYCMAARPTVIELRKATPASDMEVLGINVGGADSLAKVKRYEERNPAPYPVLYDADGKVAHSYQIRGIPFFILIDKAGKIEYRGSTLPSNMMKSMEKESRQ
jgi:thiol-disulfide isomerase/thioredoxin